MRPKEPGLSSDADSDNDAKTLPPLRILIDVVHPADVLFFLHPIRRLLNTGHEVLIASREKDVTHDLLKDFGLVHRSASKAGSGVVGLAWELVLRDIKMLRLVKDFQPDIMCGFGGVSISHVGRVLGIPAIAFYDTDRAVLQQRLTLPFIDGLYVPEVYDGPTAKGRTSRFAGIKELSYLHPENFNPDRERAEFAGLKLQRRNFVLRLVGWKANHDLNAQGLSDAQVLRLVSFLAERGCVHLTSERPLPEALQCFRYRGSARDFHHLLAHCDLYVGESATIASEAIVLGVPAIYAVDDRRAYIDALVAEELVFTTTDPSVESLERVISATLEMNRESWKGRWRRWMTAKPNLASYIVEAILRHAHGAKLSSAPLD